MRSLWRGLATPWRVVGDQLIRKIHYRFGGESLGFAWIVAEPLVFAIPVLFIRRAVRDPAHTTFALAIIALSRLWRMREDRRYVVLQ